MARLMAWSKSPKLFSGQTFGRLPNFPRFQVDREIFKARDRPSYRVAHRRLR
jgi:hypothetical protein